VVKDLLAKQPHTLSLIWAKNHEVPTSWVDQAEVFGRIDRWTAFDSVPESGFDSEPPRAGCRFAEQRCLGRPPVGWRKQRPASGKGRGS